MTDHDNEQKDTEAFLRSCKTLLDERMEQIDDDTRNTLAQMRRQALAGAGKQSQRSNTWSLFAPWQAAAATAVIVGVVGLSLYPDFSGTGDELPQADDILLLTETDDLMFYQELDFYYWLEQEQSDG